MSGIDWLAFFMMAGALSGIAWAIVEAPRPVRIRRIDHVIRLWRR